MRLLRAVSPVVLVALAACSSMQSDSGLGNTKVKIIHPEVVLTQLSAVPSAARHVEGGLPIQYRLRVSNRAGDPITLKQVTLQTMGAGAYTINPTSRPFKETIQPDQFATVDFWVPATTEDTILGANGPVTLRATAQFDSPMGQFNETVVQQVNGMTGQSPQ